MPRSRHDIARKPDARVITETARIWLAKVRLASLPSSVRFSISVAIKYVLSDAFSATATKSDLARAVRRLGSLLDRVQRSIPDDLRSGFLRECRSLDLDPTLSVSPLTGTLAHLSDVLRANIAPWDLDVDRRFGIACRSDGFPLVTPALLPGEVLGAFADELEHVAIPTETFTVLDHSLDDHLVVGPAPDAGGGRISIDRLRAWRKVSLAKLKKEMERLPAPEDRKPGAAFGASWPFPCGLPGLSSPGVRGSDKTVDITIYLRVEQFGAVPSGLDDVASSETDQQLPALPSFVRDASAGLPASDTIPQSTRRPSSFFAKHGLVLRATDSYVNYRVIEAGTHRYTLLRHPDHLHVLYCRDIDGNVTNIDGDALWLDDGSHIEPLRPSLGERRS